MTVGGEVLTFNEFRDRFGLEPIEHVGVKGMKWGIRKTPAQKAAKKAEKRQFKMASKLNAGEFIVSGLVGGPLGIIGYKAIKRHAAVVKRRNSDLSPSQQTDAAGKLRLGEAVAVGVITGPVGLVTYGAAKAAAAHQVDDF
jgi:hypothetical protein